MIVFSASATLTENPPPRPMAAATAAAPAVALIVELSVAVTDPACDRTPLPVEFVTYDWMVWPIRLTVLTPAPAAARAPNGPAAAAAEPAITSVVTLALLVADWFSSSATRALEPVI